MKTKKIILIAVAVAVVVGGGIWFFTGLMNLEQSMMKK